jgi:hypothetical protein
MPFRAYCSNSISRRRIGAVRKVEKLTILDGREASGQALAFSPDGKILAWGSRDRKVICSSGFTLPNQR